MRGEDDDELLVGAMREDSQDLLVEDMGAGSLFGRGSAAEPQWTLSSRVTASDPQEYALLGTVAIDGRTAVIGAYNAVSGPTPPNSRRGAACVFCLDDALEENDDAGTASPLPVVQFASHRLCGGDLDYFAIPLAAGETVDVSVLFTHADGDLDLTLLDPTGTPVAQSTTGTDNERSFYQAAPVGTHTLVVAGVLGVENPYTLRVDQAPGVRRYFLPLARLQQSP